MLDSLRRPPYTSETMKPLALAFAFSFAAQSAWGQAGVLRPFRSSGKSDSDKREREKEREKPEPEKKEKKPGKETKTEPSKAKDEKPPEPGDRDHFTFTDDVKAVAFSAEGRYAAARGPDGGPDRVKIWDTRERRMHLVLEAGWSGTPETLAVGPDGDTIASGDGSDIALWDMETGQPWRRFEDKAPSTGALAFDPKTKYFAGVMGTRVLIWPLEQKRRNDENAALSWPDSAEIRALSFSPDGKMLAAIGFRSPQRTRGQIDVLDPATGGVIKTLQDAEVGFFCGGFSRNGRVLVSAGVRPTPDGPRAELVFWSVSTWKVLLRIPTNINGEVFGTAFSPDGLSLVAVIGGHA
ncbi:MAG: hypothetical protein COR54_05860, partial [Elusimicrobia bacterium CG22_combo_CG10-13_8_21_14_all_63_91]